MSTNFDPFLSVVGSIAPLTIGTSEDEYSIKVTTKKCPSQDTQINVYSGTFSGDIISNAIGLQAAVMTGIESAIQQMYETSFLIGPLPSLGRPSGFVFQPNDILVSFAVKNDYFIFNGTGATREVRFLSTGQPEVSYLPGAPGAPLTYTFDSPLHDLTYTVSYPATGIFTITDSRGRITNFDSVTTSPVVIRSYKGISLNETIEVDLTQTYKTTPYTEIGITMLPAVLPVDPLDIIVAEGQVGFFYNEGVVTSSQDLIDYIFLQYPTFTVRQKDCITRFIQTIFNPVRNVIYHVLNIHNRDSFSVNNGFASFGSINGITMEIRAT
jgi:hypothetical protein